MESTSNMTLTIDRIRLRELRRSRGWKQPDLARAAGFTADYVSQIERGKNRPRNSDTIEAFASALDVPATELVVVEGGEAGEMSSFAGKRLQTAETFRAKRTMSREKSRARSGALGRVTGEDLGAIGVPEKNLELSLDAMAEVGVALAIGHYFDEARDILRYLVDPIDPGILLLALREHDDIKLHVAAAVATSYYAHLHMDTGRAAYADLLFERALDLIGDADEATLPGEREEWERWRRLTTRSRKDLDLWCDQMLGVLRTNGRNPRQTWEAIGRLNYVASEGKRRADGEVLRANALRDMARAKLVLSPTASEIGRDLGESIALQADRAGALFVAATLVTRAGWQKGRKDFKAMDLDAGTALSLAPPNTDIVRTDVLNGAATIYTDLDPKLAERLAKEAWEIARQRGYVGQERNAKAILGELKTS